jgi:hypothetical protein
MRKFIFFMMVTGLSFSAQANLLSTLNVVAGPNQLSVSVDLNANTSEAIITVTGPADKYFAVGFNGELMNETYAIVCNQNGVAVEERKLGNHNAGDLLASSITVESSSVIDGQLTLVLKRPLAGQTADHFDFSSVVNDSSVSTIYTVGSSQSLVYHGISNRGVTSMTFSEQVTGLANTKFKQSIQMFPNPAQSEVNVVFERVTGVTEVKIMTHQGQVVRTQMYESDLAISVPLEDVQPGAYFLIVKNKDHEALFYMIKE